MKRMKEGAAVATVAAVDLPPEPTAQERVEGIMRRARLLMFIGRGTRGKSTLARFLIERARASGACILVVDADRVNASLAAAFPDAIVPESGDDADVEATVAGLVERIASTHENAGLDMGGGDTNLRRLAAEMTFSTWLPSIGIDPVAIHVMGPSPDDCSALALAEEGGLLAFPKTILVFNEGIVPSGQSPTAAFSRAVQEQPVVRRTLERGARLCVMPRLGPLPDIEERGLTFADAAANMAPTGVAPLGVWRAQQVAVWLRRMAENFSNVEGWLP